MNKLIERIKAMSTRQQMIAAGGAVVLLCLIAVMFQVATAKKMALLYSGLSETAAGEVIAALDDEAIAYEVRGRSLFVDQQHRDAVRLRLAAQNLPSPDSQGYELLDKLDGFSTTSEMFSVTYWRAKEGELARTLTSMPGITAARVHIGAEDRGAFSRRSRQRTASVAITAPSGLDEAQVKAIRYLTALAVPGLPANEVAVIDSARGLLSNTNQLSGLDGGRAAASLEQRLLSLVEARVGMGNARVNVAIDFDRQREEIQERAIDPNGAVITQSIRENNTSREQGTERAVTVASDLPDGEDSGTERSLQSDETREEVNYAVSSTERRVEILPGGVDRLSVAVLINDSIGPDGQPLARTEDDINALRSLIAAAAGIDEARGDTLIVRSLPFDALPTVPDPAPTSWYDKLAETSLIEIATLGIFLLLFGLLVLRPMFTAGPGNNADPILIAESLEADQMDVFGNSTTQQDPRLLIRDRSAERPEDAATLLNAWLDEKEDAA